jgi:hypothetical protein
MTPGANLDSSVAIVRAATALQFDRYRQNTSCGRISTPILLVYEMVDVIEPYHTNEDEIESDDVVQQARDYQNQNSGDKGSKRPDVRVCEGHFIFL